MQKPIEKIICELIQKSLNLPDNYGKDSDGNVIPCVTIRAQNIKLFNTSFGKIQPFRSINFHSFFLGKVLILRFPEIEKNQSYQL